MCRTQRKYTENISILDFIRGFVPTNRNRTLLEKLTFPQPINKFTALYWTLQSFHKSQLSAHIISQRNPLYVLQSCFFKILCNISSLLRLGPPLALPFWFRRWLSLLRLPCLTPGPHCFFHPVYFYFAHLKTQYFPRHPVLEAHSTDLNSVNSDTPIC